MHRKPEENLPAEVDDFNEAIELSEAVLGVSKSSSESDESAKPIAIRPCFGCFFSTFGLEAPDFRFIVMHYVNTEKTLILLRYYNSIHSLSYLDPRQ